MFNLKSDSKICKSRRKSKSSLVYQMLRLQLPGRLVRLCSFVLFVGLNRMFYLRSDPKICKSRLNSGSSLVYQMFGLQLPERLVGLCSDR